MASTPKPARSGSVGAGKDAAQKAILRAISPYLAIAVAIVLVIGVVIMFVLVITNVSSGGASQTERDSSIAATAGGVTPTDLAVVRPIGNSDGIPWTILTALPLAQTQAGATPGYNGPYQIKSGTPGISDADAANLGLATTFIAQALRAQIAIKSEAGGVVYQQDSLITGAAVDGTNGGLTYANSPADIVKASAATKTVFVEAMVGLPVGNATQNFMGSVFDTAQAWALGSTLTCVGSSAGGTASGVLIPLPHGALAGLTAPQTSNAGLIYNAAITAGVGSHGAQIGMAVALAESELQNYANDGTSTLMSTFSDGFRQLNAAERATAKESLNFPHDAVGSNLDSIGLFQQRPSANWGLPSVLIDPTKSAGLFFGRLIGVSNWKVTDTPWAAGQAVQGSPSSDGSIYQAQYLRAGTIIAALISSGTVSFGGPSSGAAATGSTVPISDGQSSTGTAGSGSPTGSSAIPYALPATHGATGTEEPVNSAGQVPSGRGVGTVTFSQFASLGDDYDNYYITMRWNYAAWNNNGTSTGIDNAQYSWFGSAPRMVLVTNPRTGKSIISPVLESGPGPWVGVTRESADTDATGVWQNPTRGTPSNYKGIVSGFPPKAIAALGATTGYPGQQGDDLIYQWAPDQKAKPGPTSLIAKSDGGNGTTGGSAGSCSRPCPISAPPVPTIPVPTTGATPTGAAPTRSTSAASATSTAPASSGVAGSGAVPPPIIDASGNCSTGGSIVVSDGPNITLPDNPNISAQLRGKIIKAPTAQVAAGLIWALGNTLGVPYIYGGGGLGSTNEGGPDNGMARAAGQENAGSGTGYDCSGLSWTVLFHMNPSLRLPYGNSGDMAQGGAHVPYSQLLPGDLVTFDGHVAVSLGFIDGVSVIMEAPEPGKNIRVVPMFRSDYHSWVSRYWVPSP